MQRHKDSRIIEQYYNWKSGDSQSDDYNRTTEAIHVLFLGSQRSEQNSPEPFHSRLMYRTYIGHKVRYVDIHTQWIINSRSMHCNYTKFSCIDAISFGRAILKLRPNSPWLFPYCFGIYSIHNQRTRLVNTSFRHIYLMHSNISYSTWQYYNTQINHCNGYKWEVKRGCNFVAMRIAPIILH